MILYMFFSVQNIWDWEARFNFLCGFCPARQLCDNLYFYLPYVDSSAINDRYDIVYKCFFFQYIWDWEATEAYETETKSISKKFEY